MEKAKSVQKMKDGAGKGGKSERGGSGLVGRNLVSKPDFSLKEERGVIAESFFLPGQG